MDGWYISWILTQMLGDKLQTFKKEQTDDICRAHSIQKSGETLWKNAVS